MSAPGRAASRALDQAKDARCLSTGLTWHRTPAATTVRLIMNRKRIIPFRFHGYVEFENVSKAAVNTTHSALRKFHTRHPTLGHGNHARFRAWYSCCRANCGVYCCMCHACGWRAWLPSLAGAALGNAARCGDSDCKWLRLVSVLAAAVLWLVLLWHVVPVHGVCGFLQTAGPGRQPMRRILTVCPAYFVGARRAVLLHKPAEHTVHVYQPPRYDPRQV